MKKYIVILNGSIEYQTEDYYDAVEYVDGDVDFYIYEFIA